MFSKSMEFNWIAGLNEIIRREDKTQSCLRKENSHHTTQQHHLKLALADNAAVTIANT